MSVQHYDTIKENVYDVIVTATVTRYVVHSSHFKPLAYYVMCISSSTNEQRDALFQFKTTSYSVRALRSLDERSKVEPL